MLDFILAAMPDTVNNEMFEEALSLGDVEGKMYINSEWYIERMDYDMVMKMQQDGMDISMDMKAKTTYHNPGQNVVIEFPDFSDYEGLDDEETEP